MISPGPDSKEEVSSESPSCSSLSIEDGWPLIKGHRQNNEMKCLLGSGGGIDALVNLLPVGFVLCRRFESRRVRSVVGRTA